jgi:hypothetical protein
MVTATTNDVLTPVERAVWSVTTYDPRPVTEGGFIRRTIEVGRSGPQAGEMLARLEAYQGPTPDEITECINRALTTQAKVTVLRRGENYLGAPFFQVRQGRLFQGSKGVALLPTGKRTHGIVLGDVVDIVEGASQVELDLLASRLTEGTGLPSTSRLCAEDLEDVSSANPLAVLWTHPGFGSGAVPGCVWIIDSVEDDIVNGYLWCPPSELCSEHGSVEVKDLMVSGARIDAGLKISIDQAHNLPEDPAEAYTALFA